LPKLLVVIRANAALDEIAQSAHSLAFLSHLKKINGAVISHLEDVRTTKETAMDKEGSRDLKLRSRLRAAFDFATGA
jgi:hypothetical protein